MRKLVTGLLLVATIICWASIGVFATHYTDPHSPMPDSIVLLTHDANLR